MTCQILLGTGVAAAERQFCDLTGIVPFTFQPVTHCSVEYSKQL